MLEQTKQQETVENQYKGFSKVTNAATCPFPLCNTTVKFKRNLYTHLKTHHSKDKPRFECNFCDKTYLNKSSLRDHVDIDHFGKRINCEMCDFQAKKTSHLKSHMMRHHERIMNCKLCPYSSNNKMHFKAHVSSHKDGLYKCEDCEYQSEFVAMMKEHVDSGQHIEWECNGCNYLTRRRGKFSYHLKNCRGLMETRPST